MSSIRRKAGWLGVGLAILAFVMIPAGAGAGPKLDPSTSPIKFPDEGPVSGDPDTPGDGLRAPKLNSLHMIWIPGFAIGVIVPISLAFGDLTNPHE